MSSRRSPVRTRPVAVLPPTGLARQGTGAPPVSIYFFTLAWSIFVMRCFSYIDHHQLAKMCPGTCSSAPRHRPRPMGGCHPTRCLPLPEPPLRLIRFWRLGQWGSNLGPAPPESRVLPLKHGAPHQKCDPISTQPHGTHASATHSDF